MRLSNSEVKERAQRAMSRKKHELTNAERGLIIDALLEYHTDRREQTVELLEKLEPDIRSRFPFAFAINEVTE